MNGGNNNKKRRDEKYRVVFLWLLTQIANFVVLLLYIRMGDLLWPTRFL